MELSMIASRISVIPLGPIQVVLCTNDLIRVYSEVGYSLHNHLLIKEDLTVSIFGLCYVQIKEFPPNH